MKKIWFCFVTKDNQSIASKLIASIENQILKFKTCRVNLLIIDKSRGSENISIKKGLFDQIIYYPLADIKKLEDKYASVYTNINYDISRDSIQRARLQLYIVSKEHSKEFENSIIWQLDDDMIFGETTFTSNGLLEFKLDRNYCQTIRDFHKLHPKIDAAIGFCSYVPPLPQYLYLRKQLDEFISKKKQANFGFQHEDWSYHDLYDTQPNHYSLPKVNGKLDEGLLSDVFRGKPIHPILTIDESPLVSKPQNSYLRGGNFIIFNTKVLTALPHLAFSFREIISRRSDMLHIWMLVQQGFNIKSIDLSLIHNRDFKEISFPRMNKAYFEDLLGAVAFRYIAFGKQEAGKRYSLHKNHLNELHSLSIKLGSVYHKPYLEEFKYTLSTALAKIESFDWAEIETSLNNLKSKTLSYLPLKVTDND